MKKIIFILFCFISLQIDAQPFSKVDNGFVDLSKWNFKDDGIVSLSGNWHFFYNNDLSESENTSPVLLFVPSVWNKLDFPGIGYGTYKLKVILPHDTENYSIKVYHQSTAYNIYINNILVEKVGVFGKNTQSSSPDSKICTFKIPKISDTITIAIEISNFHYKKGGLWERILIGTEKQINNQTTRNLLIDALLIGSLFILFFYNLGIYYLRRTEKTTFFFAILCLLVLIRLAFVQEKLVLFIFPDFSWAWQIRIEFCTFFLLIPLGLIYIRTFFPNEFPKKIVYSSLIIGVLCSVFSLFAKVLWSTYLIFPYQIIVFFLLIFVLTGIIKAVVLKRQNSVLILISLLVISICTINDILNTMYYMKTGYWVHYGFFVFFFGQSFAISKLYSNAFSRISSLSDDLALLNLNLEVKIIERTDELNEQKNEVTKLATYLQQMNDNLVTVNHELSNTKLELTEKNIQLSELVEELKTSKAIIESINQELENLSVVAKETINAVMIIYQDGTIEWVNEGFRKLYGYSLDEFKQRGSNLFVAATNQDVVKQIKNAIENKTTLSYDTELIHKDGYKMWIHTTWSPIFDQEGNIMKMVGIDSDISQLKEAEQKISSQNKLITDSIHYAKKIQQAILPSEDILTNLFSDYFVWYLPRDIVSGDFYWFTQIDRHFVIAVADCTGHGVPGAFLSMLGLTLLNEIVRHKEITKANLVLNELRELIKLSLGQTGKHSEAKDGMDVSFCTIDFDTLTLQYAGANNTAYLIRKETHTNHISGVFENIYSSSDNDTVLCECPFDRMPVGIYMNEKESFTNTEIQLYKGDVLYLFSDGFQDQFGGEQRSKYMTKYFREFILSIQNYPIKSHKELLEKEFYRWKGSNDQIDDITVFSVSI